MTKTSRQHISEMARPRERSPGAVALVADADGSVDIAVEGHLAAYEHHRLPTEQIEHLLAYTYSIELLHCII